MTEAIGGQIACQACVYSNIDTCLLLLLLLLLHSNGHVSTLLYGNLVV